MDSMNAAEIRRAFADFCGTDRYRQFVSAIWSKAIPKQRLVYWQEQLWREYSKSSSSILPTSFVELYEVFRVCPRHLEPLEILQESTGAVLDPMLRGLTEGDIVRLFPFAVLAVTHRGVTEWLSCPACRSELKAHTARTRPS